MGQSSVRILVEDESSAAAATSAQELADQLRQVEGTLSIERHKSDSDSMDLGNIIEIVCTSGASLTLAKGVADWLRARRGVKLVIETNSVDRSIKTIVQGIDPEAAERIVERHI